MQKIKLFGIILGSLFFISCRSQAQNTFTAKRTIITGLVTNFSEKYNVIIVNYCDPIQEYEVRYAQKLSESQGSFLTEHKYTFAQNLTVRLGNQFINVFIHPGDSVFITIDANKLENNLNDAVRFSGDNANLNQELFSWTTSHQYNYTPQVDYTVSPADFLKNIEANFKAGKDSIQAYASQTNMSRFLEKWAFIDYKFTQANQLMDYDHPEANNWNLFTHPIFDVFNEDNFQTMMFPYHLGVCMNALIRDDAELKQLFTAEKQGPAIRLLIKKLSEKAPKGIVRDVMLFDFLKARLKENIQLYDSIPEIATAFSQAYFHHELKTFIEKQRKGNIQVLSQKEKSLTGILHLNNETIENISDVKLLNYLAANFKNKVLYIDVWATWCGPCKKEFELIPDLHKYFKDTKEVVFVNLCLESNTEQWKQTIAKHQIKGENYYLDGNASKLFMAENNLSGFPSYLIIDKDGKIHYSVHRPSNLEAAIQDIESCLTP